MDKTLLITPRLCKDCGTCESVCDNAAVSVIAFADDEASIAIPVMCMQCEEAACMDVCPVGALYRDVDDTVLVDVRRCIGCKLCVGACPFGNIEFNFAEKRIVKCDLCGGSPDCAKYCPTSAIVYASATASALDKKRALAARFKSLMDVE
ncbi:MAG: 4Fe-4S binding protein [Coriobacteriales bacterium]|jgi:Fe-S-cluster-containing hydrogenase component 2|nr:4Fe-4S binding protein [Coriobacteriales bacterium]